VTVLGALMGGMDGYSGQEVKEHCIKALSAVGASDDFCLFFADVLQCEYDMNHTIWGLQQKLKLEEGQTHLQPDILLKAAQDMTKNFNMWKGNIDALADRGQTVSALALDPKRVGQSNVVKALCSLETNEVNLKEGEEIVITDSTHPNRLKIKNSDGIEGYVPALCCFLPTPDKSAFTAAERLRIQLLASWTECVRKIRSRLTHTLFRCSKALTAEWKSNMKNMNTVVAKDRVSRRFRKIMEAVTKQHPNSDLTKLHNALFSLERELNSWNINGTDLSVMIEAVINLDKAVLVYQMFHKNWYMYRKTLESSDRPIRIVESMDNLRPVKHGKNFKYYETRMTLENTETVEEITFTNPGEEEGMVSAVGGGASQRASATQITRASQEENRKFVIRAVIDPRDKKEISIQAAIEAGIVDQTRGMYVNPKTGEGVSIPEAMNTGLIKVEYTSATRTEEKTKAVGLITIKTKVDNREYSITGAFDAGKGEKVDYDESLKRGIISEDASTFKNTSSNEVSTLEVAIDQGWVFVEYDPEGPEPTFETKTYAVNAVVDQAEKKKVPFMEAVRKGLIERETGNYVNNVTGERTYVGDAIKRGFLKAKVVDDPSDLDIDAENKMVVNRMDMIRKNVLKGMGVINAFRKASKVSNTQQNGHH